MSSLAGSRTTLFVALPITGSGGNARAFMGAPSPTALPAPFVGHLNLKFTGGYVRRKLCCAELQTAKIGCPLRKVPTMSGEGGIDPPGAAPGTPAPSGERQVEVTVVESHHLPKKDLMGKCDAFCIVDFAGQTWKSTVKQKAYDAVWNESHTFSVPDASAPAELRVTVKDDDMVSGSDLVRLLPHSRIARYQNSPTDL